jgi:photosystem II stability/assembly factor-like uncharacterized protein
VRLACLSFAVLTSAAFLGCGGSADCPALSIDMQSLAAKASTMQLDVYDQTASCDGNDVAQGAPAPLVSRTLDGHAGTTLMLPPGHYVVVMHAFDATGAFIGSACDAEVFTPGQHACVSVALSTPMIDGDGGIPADLANGGSGGGGGGNGGGGDMATIPFTAQTSPVTTVLYQPWSAGNGVAYIAGAFGVILKTTDHGASWTKLTSGTSNDLEAIWGSGPNDIYAVGLKGTVLHSTNGTTWSSMGLGAAALYDVWGTSATDVYIVGSGVVYHGGSGGFSALSTPVTGQQVVNCVWGASASDVYMLGTSGFNLHGSAAAGFTKQTAPTADVFLYGWGAGSEMWAPSSNQMQTSSTIWHTTDHGASWQSQLTTASAVIAMWSTAGGDTFAVGTSILESTDHGATWPQVGTAPAILQGIGGDPAGVDIWAVGFNGTILHRGM